VVLRPPRPAGVAYLPRHFLDDLEMLSWSIVYETSQTPPGHVGGILDLYSRWHHLDHDPDPVIFAQ
jgi:hypothetical protein